MIPKILKLTPVFIAAFAGIIIGEYLFKIASIVGDNRVNSHHARVERIREEFEKSCIDAKIAKNTTLSQKYCSCVYGEIITDIGVEGAVVLTQNLFDDTVRTKLENYGSACTIK